MLATQRVCDPATAPDEAIALRGPKDVLSYQELRAIVADAACIARDLDGGTTPYVALIDDGSPAAMAWFCGLAHAGCAVGVIDGGWSSAEVSGALAQLAPCAVVARAGWVSSVEGHLFEIGPGWHGYRLTGGATGSITPPNGETTFYVGFTSGSAGRPKAFQRSHGSWWRSFVRFDGIARLGVGDRVVIPGPFSSSHFLFGALHGLHAGATVEMVPLAAGLRADDQVAAAAVYVVPTMLVGAASLATDTTTDPRVFFCAGARLEAAVRAQVTERFPSSSVVEYYGASELSFVAIRRDGDGTPPGAVGRPFPGVKVAIRDPDGQTCPPSTVGIIYVDSDIVFQGYRGDVPVSAVAPEADGWLTVGDRGYLDEDGFLHVEGRGSALIIQGGVNVQPEEVEEIVADAPGVHACVVVGAPHDRWGQEVVAVVVCDPAVPPTRSALRTHIAKHLTTAKRPHRYLLFDGPIPLGRSGKVDRPAVAAMVQAGTLQEIR